MSPLMESRLFTLARFAVLIIVCLLTFMPDRVMQFMTEPAKTSHESSK
jgi:hypothetical protein